MSDAPKAIHPIRLPRFVLLCGDGPREDIANALSLRNRDHSILYLHKWYATCMWATDKNVAKLSEDLDYFLRQKHGQRVFAEILVSEMDEMAFTGEDYIIPDARADDCYPLIEAYGKESTLVIMTGSLQGVQIPSGPQVEWLPTPSVEEGIRLLERTLGTE